MEEMCCLKQTATCFLVLCLVSAGTAAVLNKSCPLNCMCVFDDALQDCSASCNFDNSTLDVAWSNSFDHVTLSLACQNATRDQKYLCSDFPQFPIRQEEGWLSVKGCGPGALNCASGVFAPDSRLVSAELTYIVSHLNSEHFANLQHINKLNIRLNPTDVEFPSAALTSIKALNECIIRGGDLQVSPDKLQHSSLQYLQLHENKIKVLPPGVFAGLPKLKHLEIRDNLFESLDAQAFKGVSSLQSVVLEDNKLSDIEVDTFSSLKRLTSLHIRKNRLKGVMNGMFEGLDQLYELRYKLNLVPLALDTHAFGNLTSVRLMELVLNKIKVLPETLFEGSSNIRQLDLRMNRLVELPQKLLSTNTEVRYVDISFNSLKRIPSELFLNTTKLEYLNLGYNNMSSIEGVNFTHNTELKEVALEFNTLTDMNFDMFEGTSLRSLNLVHNHLEHVTGASNPGWSTKKLDLSQNKLTVFEDWFVKINGLEHLNLASNRITMIKESHIHRAKSNLTIDLRENEITDIVRDLTDTEPSRTTPDIQLYLSGNPINCNCTVVRLLHEWNELNILCDFDEIHCPNKTKLSSLDLNILCDGGFKLHPMILSNILGVIVVIIIIILCCVHRYKVRKMKRNVFEVDKCKDTIKAEVDTSKLKMKEDYKVYS